MSDHFMLRNQSDIVTRGNRYKIAIRHCHCSDWVWCVWAE